FARFLGVRAAVSFSSGRAGIYHLLKALDFAPGDEIIVPAYTFFIVPAAVRLAGLTPVFVDVDRRTLNLDMDRVEEAIGPRTRALIVAHLNWLPADLDRAAEIAERRGLALIEDCAHACGARLRGAPVGTRGVGCFAFGVGKNLSTLGGGMITTSEDGLAARLREVRDAMGFMPYEDLRGVFFGGLAQRLLTEPSVFTLTAYPVLRALMRRDPEKLMARFEDVKDMPSETPASFNLRLSNLQAALGLEQLKRIEARNARRRANAAVLTETLGDLEGVGLPTPLPETEGAFLHYTLRLGKRDRLVALAMARGVDLQRDYCSSCPDLPFLAEFARDCPNARALPREVVYVPNHPSLTEADMREIGSRVREAILAL
ncbi:MAG: aminotransferase class I/II-fold pyridoxal phosphate-dependent enzyme, partial [Candidatus Methylomirabilis sp.]|nr:aminotransferase class I/II-fold pyridoxal phosphate-dependent enzyme [Deltaproteobacteria bacterium]